MAIQYYGARYVPILTGEWNATLTYEPLSIVTYGNNSYTSKVNVPLNTPPTGEKTDPYWVLTGNYNGEIAEINGNITKIKSDIEVLKEKALAVIWENPNVASQMKQYQIEVTIPDGFVIEKAFVGVNLNTSSSIKVGLFEYTTDGVISYTSTTSNQYNIVIYQRNVSSTGLISECKRFQTDNQPTTYNDYLIPAYALAIGHYN